MKALAINLSAVALSPFIVTFLCAIVLVALIGNTINMMEMKP